MIEALRATGKDRIVLHCYFAFNDKAKQKLEDLIRSLVIQLGLLRDDCQKLLEDLFFTCSDIRRLPSCDELCELFLAMINNVGELCIVIDALDESTSRQGGSTASLVGRDTGN